MHGDDGDNGDRGRSVEVDHVRHDVARVGEPGYVPFLVPLSRLWLVTWRRDSVRHYELSDTVTTKLTGPPECGAEAV